MAIETIKISNTWTELPVMTGEVITIFSLCSNNQYAEVYIGDAVLESNKGIPVRAFKNIKFKKPTGKIFAKNPYGESSVVITDTLISGLADGSGVNVALIKEDVDLMKPMFTDLCCGQIQNFVSGIANSEGILYKDDKGVWYCNNPNEDAVIDPTSDNWIDFSVMGGFYLLQKRSQYIYKMNKIKPTDSFIVVDNFLPIGDPFERQGTHVLNDMVFHVMYVGENLIADVSNPVYIQFLDRYGNKIGDNPLALRHVDGNVGGYVNYEGRLLTGTILTFVKPAGKEYFVKM